MGGCCSSSEKSSRQDEVMPKGLKKLYNMDLKNLYPLPNVIGVTK